MEKQFILKDEWNNELLEIITNDNLIVNAYHLKNTYCAEFVFNTTKIRIYKNRRYKLEEMLGMMNIENINYYSSNGSIISKKLIKTPSEYDFKDFEYKYVKVKED